jgi:hypothetical protein
VVTAVLRSPQASTAVNAGPSFCRLALLALRSASIAIASALPSALGTVLGDALAVAECVAPGRAGCFPVSLMNAMAAPAPTSTTAIPITSQISPER